ncbi:MAG TPA: helix-turn-helix transcriptional regulator [Chthoniobacterales bacterium]|jgi:ribosome-binding protein aMBF1 (putative translation factor)|nr:helix-turn-helix transcriptional regulator [Chthoniobacterales bacterium]
MTIVIYHVNIRFCYDRIVPKTDAPRAISLEVVRLLKKERIRSGISMNRLAEKAGLSQSMVSLLERGMRTPTLDTLLRISAALNVDLSKLLKRGSKRR